MSNQTITQLVKQAQKAREAGSDTFGDYLLQLRQAKAHKAAGFKSERPYYAKEFGIKDRSLSDWSQCGRIRAALTSQGVNLADLGDAGVTSYLGLTPDKASLVKERLGNGSNLKVALLETAGHNLSAFIEPEKVFNEILGDNLPPAFEALQLSLITLAFDTKLETLKEGQQALWECYEALGLLLLATDRDLTVEEYEINNQ
jgi:hypothetical protein